MPNIVVNGAIFLPPDMYWVDEFSWSPVALKEAVSVTGATIVQSSKRTDGRRITLKSSQECAWLTRANLVALKTLEETQTAFPLVLGDGTAFTVLFAGGEQGQSIETEALQPGKEPADGDYFIAILRFMEVEE